MTDLNKYSNVPLYCQLKEVILSKINNAEYLEDSKIPSEQEFCNLYNISRPTVRQAINDLTKSGELYKLKGKGTYITKRNAVIEIAGYSGFTDSILDGDKNKEYISIGVTSCSNNSNLGNIFSNTNNNEFAEIKYLTSQNNDAIAYNISYIPLSLFPDICDHVKNNNPSFEILKGKYPLVPTATRSSLEIAYTNDEEARFLEIQSGQALIKIKNTLFSKSGKPVEFIVSKYRADKCKLIFEDNK